MKRTEVRELLMQLLFQMEAQNDFSKAAQEKFFEPYITELEDQKKYVDKFLVAYIANSEEIDQIIEESSVKWHVKRIAKVDLAVLRLAVTEIKFLKDSEIPVQVSINEAVNMVKKYSSDDSGKFVNGVLGNMVK